MARRWPVLLVARELGLGGSERQLAETAMGLDRSRFEPHVGCFRGGGFRAEELRAAGVPILDLGVRSLVSSSALAGARRLQQYVAAHHIALVHAFDVPANLLVAPVGRLLRVPAVLTSQRAHRSLTPGFRRYLLRVTDRLAHGIVVNSKAVARELTEEDGVSSALLRLAYNGLDTGVFQPRGAAAAVPWRGDVTVIGTVCALRPEKGLPLLLEAFARVRHTRPGIKLLVVGCGPLLPDLARQAEALGLGADCHFQPATPNVAEWMRVIGIFVLPSLSEAFSNALLEAMGCGCCAIASDTGGNPELIRDGETGLLFAAGNTESLAERLSQALDDRALSARLAENAAKEVRERFSRETAAHRMGEIYLEFLEPRGRQR